MATNGPVYHLTPQAIWESQAGDRSYVPETFDHEGFVHCTVGASNVVETGNRYYQGDPREFVALRVDLSRVTAPVSVEDAEQIYPHVHGPIDAEAVVAVEPVRRNADGSFVAVGS